MIPDLDIYRAAAVLVKHHGQDAPIYAAMPSALPSVLVSARKGG